MAEKTKLERIGKNQIAVVSSPQHGDVASALAIGLGTPFGSLMIRPLDKKGTLGLCLSRDKKTADPIMVIQPGHDRIVTALWAWAVTLAVKAQKPSLWKRTVYRAKWPWRKCVAAYVWLLRKKKDATVEAEEKRAK